MWQRTLLLTTGSFQSTVSTPFSPISAASNMSNNPNNQRQRNIAAGTTLVVTAVGALVGLAAVDHVRAQEENRESVVQGVGRWIRENIIDPATATATTGNAARSGSDIGNGATAIASRLSPGEVNVLPVRRIGDETQGSSMEDVSEKAFCVVCREHYSKGDMLMRLPCFHEFHADCIRDYLETSESPVCPICRHPVTLS